jgi:hypothetical protein
MGKSPGLKFLSLEKRTWSKHFEFWPPNFEFGVPKMGKSPWIKHFEFTAKDPGIKI